MTNNCDSPTAAAGAEATAKNFPDRTLEDTMTEARLFRQLKQQIAAEFFDAAASAAIAAAAAAAKKRIMKQSSFTVRSCG